MAAPLGNWETLSIQELFSSPWVRVLIQQVRLPDGRVIDDYYKVELRDYTGVVARTCDGKIVFERQYKHGVGHVSLMLPGGAIENGESPLSSAQRELLEETGYVADEWRFLGSFVTDANQGISTVHLFCAEGAQLIQPPDSQDLEDMETVLMNPDEIASAVQNGEIAVLGVIAALALSCKPELHKGLRNENVRR